MNTTSSQLPVCVHCGTPRPADETLCPKCGKPWIDTTIKPASASDAEPPTVAPGTGTDVDAEEESDQPPVGAVAAAAAIGVAASIDTGEDEPEEEPTNAEGADSSDADTAEDEEPGTDHVGTPPPPAQPGGVAAAATVGAKSVSADEAGNELAEATPVVVPPPPADLGPDDTGEFAFDTWTQPPEDEEERRGTAWLVPAGIVVVILAAVAYLLFGGGNAPSTTTAAEPSTTVAPVSTTNTSVTTTTQAPTTTVIAFPLPGDWPPNGEPIDTADLTLTQSAIGPIDIGTSIDDVAGALTASLGEATASGIDGLCPPEESYWLQFGQLTAIFDGFDSASLFVSYRYDEPQGDDSDLGLKTLSGIAIGDTVEDLINTYTQFTISFEIIDSKDYFRLSDGGDLLLWGPVSSVDPAGLIEGIYSPTACETTP
jgi:hypothetical protein